MPAILDTAGIGIPETCTDKSRLPIMQDNTDICRQ